MEGTQLALFQTESKGKVEEELNTIVKEFILNNGGKVQAWDSLVNKYGRNYAAAFNVLTKTIDYAKGKIGKDTLPEEAGHFILEGLGENNLLVKNIYNLVSQLDYRAEIAKIDPEYFNLYKNDDTALKKELAGKYLGQAIQNKFETKGNSILDQIKRTFTLILNKFISMFKNSDQKKVEEIKSKITELTGSLGQQVLNKENLGMTFPDMPTNPIFYQTASAKVKVDRQHKFAEQEAYFERRINELKEIIRRSKNPETLEKTQENIDRLSKYLRDFRETRNKDFLREMAVIVLDGIEDYMNYLDTKGTDKVKLKDKNINYAREALKVLTGFVGVSDRVGRLQERFSEIEDRVLERTVNEYATEGKEIPLEEIKAQVKDINRGSKLFGALQDVKNFAARTIASIIKAAQNRISTTNKQLTDRIQAEVDAIKTYQSKQGVSSKDTYKIFIQNYRGTTVLTREFTTEFYSKLEEARQNYEDWGRGWIIDNTFLTEDGKRVPSSQKHYNENYKTIQKTPELKKFYDFHMQIVQESRDKLPIKIGQYLTGQENFIANIKKSVTEQIFNSDETLFSGLGKAIKNIIDVKEHNIGEATTDENLFGDFVRGNRFTKKLTEKEKSGDLGANLLEFAAFANSYEEMSEVLPTVRLLQSTLEKQKFTKSSSPKESILGIKSNTYGMVEDYINMQVKGEMKQDEANITIKNMYDAEGNLIGKKSIHLSQIGDMALKWNSLLRIGLNPFNALGNLGFGEISNFIESVGGRFFRIGDMNTATAIFMKQNFNEKSVVNKLLEEINPLQELEDFENPDKIRLKKLDGNKLMEIMYLPQKMGEKFIQTRTMLAIMLKESMITKEGKLTEKGENMLKDETAKERFRDKVQRVNEMLHGRYSQRDAATAQQFILWRAVMQFRKWLPAAVEARIGEKKFDVRLGEEIEGRYNSYFKGFKYMMAKLKGDINSIKRNEFTELDFYNMRKNMIELVLLASSLLLYYGLKGGEDDDEWRKKPSVKFSLNMLNRMVGDIKFFYAPNQWINISKNAMPVSRLASDLYNTMLNVRFIFHGDDKEAYYRSGPRKHEHKFYGRLADVIPAAKPLADVIRTLKKDVPYTEPR